MSAPDLSAEERSIVERFDAAEAAPESLRERVLLAAHAAACNCGDEDPAASTYWQRIADAAVAVMRGQQ